MADESRGTVLDGVVRFSSHRVHRRSRRLVRPVRRDTEARDRYAAALALGFGILICAALSCVAIASA